MARRLAWAAIYLAASLVIFLAWTAIVRTETRSGEPPGPSRVSLQKQIDGTAGPPFRNRRLVADLAPLLARLVPPAGWERFTAFVQGDSPPGRWLRRLLDFLHWPAERYPELVAGYFLIWLSVLGFLLVFRRLLALAYEMPPWLGHLAALAAGVLVLGGSDSRWASYPYDLPNLFVFTLALVGILARRWWMLPAFALACHSKETALLLIPAHAWVNRAALLGLPQAGWCSGPEAPPREALVPSRSRAISTVPAAGLGPWQRWWSWLTLLVMVGLYAGLRYWISQRFPGGTTEEFWFPRRNADLLLHQAVYALWWTAPAAVVLARIVLLRRILPRHVLVLLAGMTAALVGAGFFKGWIEERRQYLELLPLAVLIGVRWAAAELGLDWLVVTRAWPVDEQAP